MRKLTSILIAFLGTLNMLAQTKIFPDLDFENEHYELYIFEGENNNTFNLDTKFVVSDQSVIKNIVESWSGEKSSNMYLCGYNYNIYIASNGHIISTINYNSECRQARSKNGTINVETNPFTDLDKSQTFSSWRHDFNSREKGCKILDEILTTDSIFIPNRSSYEWKDHEGYFHLRITDIKIEKENNYDKDRGVTPYWSLIEKEYTDDQYIFRRGSTSINRYDEKSTKYEYSCYIHCNEPFFDKFDMGKMYKKFGWTKYDLFQVFFFGKNDIVKRIRSTYDKQNID